MRKASFQNSIFRLVTIILLLTSVTILVNVWLVTNQHVDQQMDRELGVARGVLKDVLANRERQLINTSNVLTADFGFKEAVATQDRATIKSVLDNHGRRVSADLMALISLEGTTTASVPNVLPFDQKFPKPSLIYEALNNGGAASFLTLQNKIFQIILMTVDAPTPIAIAVVGYELDNAVAQHLKNVTRLDTSIHVDRNGIRQFLSSTLPEIILSKNLQNDVESAFHFDGYESRHLEIFDEGELEIAIILSQNIGDLTAAFSKLQYNIIVISCVALLLSVFIAQFLSRQLTKPLRALAKAAQGIAAGDYKKLDENASGTREFDYLSKAFNAMQTDIEDREAEISYQAQRDALTTLFNRYYMGKLIGERLDAGERFYAVGINVHHFREVNDTFGYQNGDHCLQVLAQRIQAMGGLAARLTGGEFLWVPDMQNKVVDLQVIKNQLEEPIESENGVTMPIKLLLAEVHCPQHATTSEELFRCMNIVLDESALHETQALVYEEAYEKRYLRRLSIVSELKNALRENARELDLYYQPKFNLADKRIDSAEALIRWNSDVLGFVPPDEFIAIAEQAGIIDEVSNWVVQRAIHDLAKLSAQGVEINLAINLSAKDIMNHALFDRASNLLKDFNIEPSRIAFEIVESDIVNDFDLAIDRLHELKGGGFTTAIDDFGTGYSSLAYLKSLPVSTLKVDKSFVLKLSEDGDDRNLVETVINLAHNFNLNVVAEGVEDQSALQLLNGWGCEWAQGYFISRPLPREDFVSWYKENADVDWVTRH